MCYYPNTLVQCLLVGAVVKRFADHVSFRLMIPQEYLHVVIERTRWEIELTSSISHSEASPITRLLH